MTWNFYIEDDMTLAGLTFHIPEDDADTLIKYINRICPNKIIIDNNQEYCDIDYETIILFNHENQDYYIIGFSNDCIQSDPEYYDMHDEQYNTNIESLVGAPIPDDAWLPNCKEISLTFEDFEDKKDMLRKQIPKLSDIYLCNNYPVDVDFCDDSSCIYFAPRGDEIRPWLYHP